MIIISYILSLSCWLLQLAVRRSGRRPHRLGRRVPTSAPRLLRPLVRHLSPHHPHPSDPDRHPVLRQAHHRTPQHRHLQHVHQSRARSLR